MKVDEEIMQLELDIKKHAQDCYDAVYIHKIEKVLDYYKDRGLLHNTIVYADLLKHLYEKGGRNDQLCGILNLMGKVYSLLQETDKALQHLDRAQELSCKIGNKKFEAMSLTNLALLMRKMDKIDKSLEFYFRAKNIMEDMMQNSDEKTDKYLIIDYLQVLDQIGVIYSILKQSDKALEYLEMSLLKAKQAGLINNIYSTLINLGVHYSNINLDLSLKYYQEALSYLKKSKDKHILSVVLNNIGGVYEDKENYDKALEYYFQALKLAEEYEHRDYIFFFTKHIGTVYYKQRRYDEALDYMNKSLSLAKKGNHTSEVEENYLLLSKIFQEKCDYKKALEFSQQYIELKEKSLNDELQERVKVLQNKFENTKKELKITLQKNSLISDELKKKMNLDFIGCSDAIKKVHEMAMQAARTPDSNILITGESGTGKEIIANIIHHASCRRDNMIIFVNSGSIPEQLMESAFLGHKKGAFTSAVSDKVGYLEMADKGTLFLDELGDMPMTLQMKLLRVLENKIFLPIGAEKEIESDFRLITATNKNIEKLINENKFRVDLFYRINTIEIHIPPLRDRIEDILPLTEHFLKMFAKTMNKSVPKLGAGVIRFLENYSFPGNVRELKNMMERVMIVLKGDTIFTDDLMLRPQECVNQKMETIKLTTLAKMENNMIKKALEKTGNNISQAAKLLGIHYTTLNRKLKLLNK